MRNPTTFYIIFLAFAFSCTSHNGTSLPETQPDMEGTITNVKRKASKTEQAVAVVLVEALPDVKTKYPKASIRINNKTIIMNAEGDPVKLEQLQDHQQVEIWFDGPVMESFPIQANASAVLVK